MLIVLPPLKRRAPVPPISAATKRRLPVAASLKFPLSIVPPFSSTLTFIPFAIKPFDDTTPFALSIPPLKLRVLEEPFFVKSRRETSVPPLRFITPLPVLSHAKYVSLFEATVIIPLLTVRVPIPLLPTTIPVADEAVELLLFTVSAPPSTTTSAAFPEEYAIRITPSTVTVPLFTANVPSFKLISPVALSAPAPFLTILRFPTKLIPEGHCASSPDATLI